MNHNPNRSKLYSDFEGYKNKILAIYDYDTDIHEAEQELAKTKAQKQELLNQLPKEVIDMYEQQMVVWKLQGKNDVLDLPKL